MTQQHIRAEEMRAMRSTRERIGELIARHPRLSDEEVREVICFMRTARHLEVGLLTSNERLRAKLDAFMEEHKGEFQLKWHEAAAVIAAIAGLLLILWLIWGAGAA